MTDTSADRVKPDVAGKVLPLVWHDGEVQSGATEPFAAWYFVNEQPDGWAINYGSTDRYQTRDKAKAAAQADYASRILSALTPDALAPIPAGEVAEALLNIDYLIDDVVVDAYVRGAEGRDHTSLQTAKKLSDAVSDLLSRMAGETWQPIETAPKDGTQFFGYTERNRFEPFDIWHWEASASTDNGYGFWINQADSNLDEQPTHWQPLPQAPK